jgi:hypothetical protein
MSNIYDLLERLQPQKNEFDKLDILIARYNQLPAIVDDDYPRCCRYYESALKDFLEACKNNKRI